MDGKHILMFAVIQLFLSAGAWFLRHSVGRNKTWRFVWKSCMIAATIYFFLSAMLGFLAYFKIIDIKLIM